MGLATSEATDAATCTDATTGNAAMDADGAAIGWDETGASEGAGACRITSPSEGVAAGSGVAG